MIKLSRVSIFCSIILLASTTCFSAENKLELESEEGRSGWHLSGGLMYSSLDNVSFRPGSRVSWDMIPRESYPGFVDVSTRFGRKNSFSDREYDDGYVRQDAGTAINGDTWYWGYDHHEQIQNDTLVFHGVAGQQTFVTQKTQINDGLQSAHDDEGAGLYLKAVKEITKMGAVSFHGLISGSYVPFSVEIGGSTIDVRQQSVTYDIHVVDTYDLVGVIPPVSPYSGGVTGPGPLLPNIPVNREIQQNKGYRSETRYFNEIREKLDVSVTTLCLGLQCEWNADFVQFIAATGTSLNMICSDSERVEVLMKRSGGSTTTEQRFHDSTDDVDFKVGAFAQVGMRFPLRERIGFELCGQYEIIDSIKGQLGPSSYKVDLDRFSLFALFSVAF